jgi:chromate reductase
MKKILAIGSSNSKSSINKVLANYVANQIENVKVTTLNWEDMVLPLYSPDLEADTGVPENATKFMQLIADSDAVILSLAEHNGQVTAAFKNLWDWTSRIDMKFWASKPMFLLATSPGGRGGIGALTIIKNIIPHFGGNIITEFTLPSFYDNFKDSKIVDEVKGKELIEKINLFKAAL